MADESDSSISKTMIKPLSEDLENPQAEHAVIVGDYLKITSPDDQELNDIWKIEYVNFEKMIIMKMEESGTQKTITLQIKDGVIQDSRIVKVELVNTDNPRTGIGYATYKELTPDKWVEMVFAGLEDTKIVGKITGLVQDSIEIVIFENNELMTKEPMTIDFMYAGLPDWILSINIIDNPTTVVEPELSVPTTPVSSIEEEYIVGPDVGLEILEERDKNKFRYGLSEQTNDLLESMLSKIPINKQMDEAVLININKNIIRYTQLRKLFSEFDENGNIMHYANKKEAINKHGDHWKPLKQSLESVNHVGWILPVAKNIKKIYDTEEEYEDVINLSTKEDNVRIIEESELYKMGNRSYVAFLDNISPNLVPFIPPLDDNTIFPHNIKSDIDVIIGNFNNNKSNTFTPGGIKKTPFQTTRYTSDINYITQNNLTKSSYTTDFHPLIPADTIHIKSLITLPDTFLKHSKIHLPGTDMVSRASLGLYCPNYSMLLKAKTPITTLIIDNINAPLNPDKEFVGTHYKQYLYNGDERIEYGQFLDYLIPSNKQIIENNKTHILQKLSVMTLINELEPYLIYSSDLTISHYTVLAEYITNNITEFFTKLYKYKTAFTQYKNGPFNNDKLPSPLLIQNIINAYSTTTKDDKDIENMNILELINLHVPKYFKTQVNKTLLNNSEILARMIKYDCGKIFNTICALSIIKLISSVGNVASIDEPATHIADEWIDKYPKYAKFTMVPSSAYSILKPWQEPQVTSILQEWFPNQNEIQRIVDATAHIGVDSIHMSNVFPLARLQSYEIVPTIYNALVKNIGAFKKQNTISPHLGDITLWDPTTSESVDLLYVDPPWGGDDYKNVNQLNLYLQAEGAEPNETKNINNLIDKWINSTNVHYVILKAPSNFDKSYLLNKYSIKEKPVLNQAKRLAYTLLLITSTMYNPRTGQEVEQNIAPPVELEQNILSDSQELVDIKLNQSVDEYQAFLDNSIEKYVLELQFSVSSLEIIRNHEKYNLGLKLNMNEIVVSPYAKYVNLIVSIVNESRYRAYQKFCSNPNICRESREDEDFYWYYCVQTNTKLIPTFFFQLATAYMKGVSEYQTKMVEILNERKAVDDNGKLWIDKYSGYTIKEIDFDTDEGYNDEGFKMNSRAVLEVDEIDQDLEMLYSLGLDETKIPLQNRINYNEEEQYVYSIIVPLSTHMKIDIQNTFGFIIKTVIKISKTQGVIMDKKKLDKKYPDAIYEDYVKEQLRYLTIAVFLIICQTRTPTLNPLGSYPGCIKSFSGYPVGNPDDKTGIIYLLCIITKTKFIKVSKKPADLNPYIDIVLKDLDIQTLINKKRRYVEEEPIDNSQHEHSILNWTSFLPALVQFKLGIVLNVSDSFIQTLIEYILDGRIQQHADIETLQSKIILFSYAIQYEIQKILVDVPLIIKPQRDNKILNENACCNTGVLTETALEYFKKNNDIDNYNNNIITLRYVLQLIDTNTKSFMWLSSEKTKFQSTQPNTLYSMNTIYAGFIKHCNFRTNIANSKEITDICGEKPQNIKSVDTIDEIINKLKQSGVEYNYEQLLQLLKLVSNAVEYNELDKRTNFVFNDITTFLSEGGVETEGLIVSEFQEKIRDCLTSNTRENITELTKYTYNINNGILTKLKSFVVNNKKNSIKLDDFEGFFINRPRTQTYFQFLKNCIINIGSIFPKMCVENVPGFKSPLPAYWGVSQKYNDVLIAKYNKVFSNVVKYYQNDLCYGLFLYVMEKSAKIIEMITKIPFLENEIGFLIMEHCLLLVLNIYTTTDYAAIINPPKIYEVEPAFADIYVRPQKQTINNEQSGVLRDFIMTLIDSDKHINISYQNIMDTSFKLKEREKNNLLKKLNDTKDLAIDNHFRTLGIGERWGGGKNVRGHDNERWSRDRDALTKKNNVGAVEGENMENDENMITDGMADDDGADVDEVDYTNEYGEELEQDE